MPAGFAVLERFPLNANGKVDRAALPAPEREAREAADPPRGETERRLAEVWRLLLEARRSVGRTDNFFALGGNSLSAARLMFRIREVFGVELPMGAFYAAPALAECAAAIDAARSRTPRCRRACGARRDRPPVPGRLPGRGRFGCRDGTCWSARARRSAVADPAAGRLSMAVYEFPASFGQRRMWLLARMDPDQPTYNIAWALWLDGELDLDALRRAWQASLARHEVLRTTFRDESGMPVQVISDDAGRPSRWR